MKFLKYFLVVGLAGGAASLPTGACAATLANYGFTSNNLNVSTTSPNVTASPFSGTGTARSTNQYAFQYAKVASSGYMQFSLTAAPGYALDLSTISFSYDFLQSAGSETPVNATFSLVYSLDSFATSIPIQSYENSSGAVVSSGAASFENTGAIDLTGIPTTSAVSFRFVLGNEANLDTEGYRYAIDSVVISGDVIPEPSAPSLGMLAAGAALFRRRRR
jgi:hypothetical protein